MRMQWRLADKSNSTEVHHHKGVENLAGFQIVPPRKGPWSSKSVSPMDLGAFKHRAADIQVF